MNALQFLLIAGVVLFLLSVTLHVFFIVVGFRTSARDGLLCLIPFVGVLIFAFDKPKLKILAAVYLTSILISTNLISVSVASAMSPSKQDEKEVEETKKNIMKEADEQMKELDSIENIQL